MNETSIIPASPKSWLSRPEGKIGLIPLVLGGMAVLWFWGEVVGFILDAFVKTFNLIIVGLAIGAILFLMADPKLRAFFFYLYKSLLRWLTGQFINTDPIGILKTYKERLEGKLSDMDVSIASLNGQREKVDRLMGGNSREIEKGMGLIAQAKKAGDARTEALQGRQVTRLTQQNERVAGDRNRIMFLLTVLNKYRQLSADTIEDMGLEIQTRQRERDYSTGSRNAVRAALSILKGLPEKDFYDDSIEALEKQYTEAIGEVDSFLDVTKDIMAKADLQDGADSEHAMQMLEAWQAKNSSLMLGGAGTQLSKADIIKSANLETVPVTKGKVTNAE